LSHVRKNGKQIGKCVTVVQKDMRGKIFLKTFIRKCGPKVVLKLARKLGPQSAIQNKRKVIEI